MAGRPPVPTQLKVLRGTINTTRQNWSEPALESRIPVAPGYLSELELEAWEKFAAILGPMRVVAAEDAVAFEMLAVTYAQHQRLAAALREATLLIYSPKTGDKAARMLRARPEMGMLADVDRRLLALLGRFGLTPADRQRVVGGAADPDADDPEDEFSR